MKRDLSKAPRVNSYVVYENDRIVVIATGFTRRSKNSKTGNAIQTWILDKTIDPLRAVKTGKDDAICFDCPFSGGNGCYVQVKNAPLNVWKSYHRGNYPRLIDLSLFKGRIVRFGSYGEPVLIPLPIVRAIAHSAAGWLGYTHQWRNPLFQSYREFFMASTSDADYGNARAQGWRTFSVSDGDQYGAILCPASKEAGHKTVCEDCGLCSGTSRQTASGVRSNRAKSIFIPAHGFKKNRARMAA